MTDDAVTAQLARQAQQLDDLEQAVGDLRTGPPPSAQPPAAQPATVPFRWATLAGFVEHVIAPLYAQHLTGNGAWCASWWDHDDAFVRLEAVWRAWEALRLEPTTGIARWLRDVADPQMDRLRDRDRGPFRACGDGKHLTAPAAAHPAAPRRVLGPPLAHPPGVFAQRAAQAPKGPRCARTLPPGPRSLPTRPLLHPQGTAALGYAGP